MSLRRYSRALPANALGAYALGATSGIIPATPLANKEIFQFRWNPTDRTKIALIRKLEVSAAVSTTYFAAGVPVEFALFKASAWSAQGTLGSGITPSTDCRRDSSMPNTNLVAGDCRIAGTDANGLGAGTKTLETNKIASVISGAPITASLSGQVFPAGVELLRGDVSRGDYPIILRPGAAAANAEGIAIAATAPATGTWRVSVNIEWDEYTAGSNWLTDLFGDPR